MVFGYWSSVSVTCLMSRTLSHRSLILGSSVKIVFSESYVRVSSSRSFVPESPYFRSGGVCGTSTVCSPIFHWPAPASEWSVIASFPGSFAQWFPPQLCDMSLSWQIKERSARAAYTCPSVPVGSSLLHRQLSHTVLLTSRTEIREGRRGGGGAACPVSR